MGRGERRNNDPHYRHAELDDCEELENLGKNALKMTTQELRMKLFEVYWEALAEKEANFRKNKSVIKSRGTVRASARISSRGNVGSGKSGKSNGENTHNNTHTLCAEASNSGKQNIHKIVHKILMTFLYYVKNKT